MNLGCRVIWGALLAFSTLSCEQHSPSAEQQVLRLAPTALEVTAPGAIEQGENSNSSAENGSALDEAITAENLEAALNRLETKIEE